MWSAPTSPVRDRVAANKARESGPPLKATHQGVGATDSLSLAARRRVAPALRGSSGLLAEFTKGQEPLVTLGHEVVGIPPIDLGQGFGEVQG